MTMITSLLPKASPLKAEAPQRILLVRLSAHGDVIHTFHVLKSLRHLFPKATIGWVVEASAAPLLSLVRPWVDEIHPLPKGFAKDLWKELLLPSKWRNPQLQAVLAPLRKQHYQIAIDAQGLLKSALLPFVLNIPKRIGYASAREGASFFYTQQPLALPHFRQGKQHASEDALKLLDAAFPQARNAFGTGPTLGLPPFPDVEEAQEIQTQLQGLKQGGKHIIALAPFTMWPSKHWPSTHWQRLMQGLAKASPTVHFYCVGGPADVQKWQALRQELPLGIQTRCIAGEGKSSWPSLMHHLKQVDILIGVDSAPLHLMDALVSFGLHPSGASMALMGPTHPKRTGPKHPHSMALAGTLPCQPCHQKRCPLGSMACMEKALTPEAVTTAALKILSGLGVTSAPH